MIAWFRNDMYMDVDSISAVYWNVYEQKGRVVVGGCSVEIKDRDTFERIKDAFIWTRGTAVYDLRDASSKNYKSKIRKDG